jgi:hypothetical protein
LTNSADRRVGQRVLVGLVDDADIALGAGNADAEQVLALEDRLVSDLGRRQLSPTIALGTAGCGANDGPNTFAVRGGLPTPRLGQGLDKEEPSPPDVRRADRSHRRCLLASILHLEPHHVIAVPHLDRATSRGEQRGKWAWFRLRPETLAALRSALGDGVASQS